MKDENTKSDQKTPETYTWARPTTNPMNRFRTKNNLFPDSLIYMDDFTPAKSTRRVNFSVGSTCEFEHLQFLHLQTQHAGKLFPMKRICPEECPVYCNRFKECPPKVFVHNP